MAFFLIVFNSGKGEANFEKEGINFDKEGTDFKKEGIDFDEVGRCVEKEGIDFEKRILLLENPDVVMP